MATDNLDPQTKEALEHWGYMFNKDKSGTEMLDRLLTGIWKFTSTLHEPSDSPDITPSQIAAFYRSVGANYDVLFLKSPPSAIQFIYKSLGALHSLQPGLEDNGYTEPYIPALKRKGFITWQTIQLLLAPDEHVPFLQEAVAKFDIIDPETNQPFLKVLPKEAFPQKPDDEMVQWYDNVSARLGQEAAATETPPRTGYHAPTEFSEDSSADERTAAAEYFRNPLYKNREGRPTIIRRVSKQPKNIVQSVRHIFKPGPRRRSLPERHGEGHDHDYEVDRTPTGMPQRPAPRRFTSHRRDSISSSSESEDDRNHSSPRLRHRRSHEVPASPREYFPPYDHVRRYSVDPNHMNDSRSSSVGKTGEPGFVPSQGKLFATQVAQLQPQYVRPGMPPRNSYARGPPSRYGAHSHQGSPRDGGTPIIREPIDRYEYDSRDSSRSRGGSRDIGRERERDRDRDRDGDRDRPKAHRYVTPVDGVGGRRYPTEVPWR